MPIDNRVIRRLSPTEGAVSPFLDFNVSPQEETVAIIDPINENSTLREIDGLIDDMDKASEQSSILTANIEDIASTFVNGILAAGVEQTGVREQQNVASTQSAPKVTVKPVANRVVDSRPMVYVEDVSDTSSEAAPLDETPEEPKTYLEMILDALYEFYQKVLELIDYLTPSYFKSAAQEPEQPTEHSTYSMFSWFSSDHEENEKSPAPGV